MCCIACLCPQDSPLSLHYSTSLTLLAAIVDSLYEMGEPSLAASERIFDLVVVLHKASFGCLKSFCKSLQSFQPSHEFYSQPLAG